MKTLTNPQNQNKRGTIIRYILIAAALFGVILLVNFFTGSDMLYSETWEVVLRFVSALVIALMLLDTLRWALGMTPFTDSLVKVAYVVVLSILIISVFWWWREEAELAAFQLNDNFYAYGGMTVVRQAEMTLYLKILALCTLVFGPIALMLLSRRKKEEQTNLLKDEHDLKSQR